MTTNAVPAQSSKPAKSEEVPKRKGKEKEKSAQTSKSSTPQPALVSRPPKKSPVSGFDALLKAITDPDFRFVFSAPVLSPEDLQAITEFPQLLDPNGGAKRRAMKEKQEEQRARERERELELQQEADAQAASQAAASAEQEETTEAATAGGSLQLGGEPEERHDAPSNRHAIAPPGQGSLGTGFFGQTSGLNEDFGNLSLNRGLTQQQQQQLLISNLKTGAPQSAGLLSNFQTNATQPPNHGQAGTGPGHARHTSRFSFANDSSSATASVQPVSNQKLMSQQQSMMPKGSQHFNQLSQHQPLGNQFYTSGVQGPPPGLKATGTPPVSGGGMFGQGHGFGTGGLGYGSNAAGRNNDAMYQDLLRNRNMDGVARVADAGKRESMFPSFLNQHPTTSTPGPAPGLVSFPYGPSPGAYQESGSQKSKKKGKKHRHANTSSSGGGGVVDVQDPSILQARLHQGGGMTGQGLYHGQGQGGFSSLYSNNNYGGGAGRW
jgi:CCR4-NOT transcription complex subunit 4